MTVSHEWPLIEPMKCFRFGFYSLFNAKQSDANASHFDIQRGRTTRTRN